MIFVKNVDKDLFLQDYNVKDKLNFVKFMILMESVNNVKNIIKVLFPENFAY